ncbi:MAG: serine protease [Planctomycetes bacterium]|nr:serine protease [Planctomycetota bacterium]MBU4398565.1 serine protease [Planctomycetota bacterium]MCG2683138.1 serine protease [Planctomycetales bacterium]
MFKTILIACVCVCLTAGALLAQDEVVAARKTLQTYEKGVITLSAVLKFEVQGVGVSIPSQERKTQCIAVIIDPDGLAVTSLKNLNPQVRAQAGSRRIEIESQVQEVKYRLADGTEVPARVVLKDEDLDLAFLAPLDPLDEQTKSKIAVIPLDDAAQQAEALDETIMIGRADDDLNYVPTIQLGRIMATISQPRTCYLNSLGTLGAPVFDRQGKLLGIVCRCVKDEGDSENVIRLQPTPSHLILPAADVARLVPQAKEEIGKDADNEKKSDAEDQ